MAMKFQLALPSLLLALALLPGQAAVAEQSQAADDRAITQVVKLLQDMLDKSKADGNTERNLYAKYKCYCDTNEAEKKAQIEKLTEEIALLENDIEELQASSAKLSKQVAKLDADKAANEAARAEATALRGQENTAFLALQTDLTTSIGEMQQAIETLSEVGADQTVATANDHKQYMAGYDGASLVKLKTTVKQALLAANAFVNTKQAKVVDAFLQAPFTGTYTAQSGEVVGILKDMLDTFTANLEAARATEARQLAAYNKYTSEMEAAWNKMDAAYNKKQGQLSDNDGDLATKRGELETSQTTKADAESFLASLLDMCAAKKKQYGERVELRMNEETAIAEAISILNSDAAFATFGTVDATKTGATSFVQTRRAAVRQHRAAFTVVSEGLQSFEASPRKAAQEFLQKAGGQQSTVLSRVAAMLQANNPFETVLKEIQKMIDLIAAEGDKDTKHKQWCDDERRVTNDGIIAKTGEITDLNTAIQTLTDAIEHPETGLKVTIKNTEDDLQTNYESQVSETKERTEDNLAYQKDISNLVEAEALVQRAIVVLKRYYSRVTDQIEGSALLQKGSEEPAPPSTWEDKYKGQSEAGGVSAIGMLEFILTNTRAEEKQAHTDENAAQVAYEDSMQGLKDEEGRLQVSLTSLKKELAEKEIELMEKQKELEKTEAEKKALEHYLVEIKPGCDFITENIELRNTNRDNEKQALGNAVTLIKGTPAYQEYLAVAHNESLGDCKLICTRDEEHVDCKACLSGVSVPGYCAGHPTTSGC